MRKLVGGVGIELETIEGKCPLYSRQIKIVGAKNFEVAQLIPQTQLVISLELATMAGPADTLKVFAAVWITSF